ncbi:MAG TPA: protein TolR [Gammaproteobacteria bacterium]|nr:protein TolR [Gammaproteobacteria bacterium]
MGEINVVPYIDVMLVLLIIFMVTAPLLTEGVKVNLPDNANAAPLANNDKLPTPVVLTVDAQGQLYLSVGENPKEPLDRKIVLARVAAVLKHKPKTPFLVKGDKTASYGDVVSGMVLLQQAGVPNVGLVVDRNSQPTIRKEQ